MPRQGTIMLRKLLVTAFLFLLPALAEAQERRMALLIGNEAYGTPGLAMLTNPHEDVDRVAASLIAAGFAPEDVTVIKDKNRGETIRAINDFSDRLKQAGSASMGFFYYSGHGGSAERDYSRENYIVPVREPIDYADDLEAFAVSLPDQVAKLQASGAGSVFVVVDACRNTLSWKGTMAGAVTKGIRREDFNPNGMMLMFAAGDGAFADDDAVFSTVLSEEIARGGQDALKAFSRVSQRVGEAKGFGNKSPVIIPALKSDVCFVSCPGVGARIGADAEDAAWLGIKRGQNKIVLCAAYTEHLRLYPEGKYAAMAKLLSASVCPGEPEDAARRLKDAQENYTQGQTEYSDGRYAEAGRLWEDSCLNGIAKGCANLGFLYSRGMGMDQDFGEALRFFKLGCDGGSAEGCRNLGLLYRNGEGTSTDLVVARRYLQQACDGGYEKACVELGTVP